MRLRLRPRWIVLSVVVAFVSVGCAILGFWQLDRLEERRATNLVIRSRLNRDVVPIETLLEALQPQDGVDVDPADYEYLRTGASGVLTDDGRVSVRSQVVNGQAGMHAVLPLDLGKGVGVLVNLGWFPLGVDPPPGAELFTPDGRIELVGFVRASRQRPALGRREPDGHLETVARIDVARIQQQVGLELLPFWIQLIEPDDPDRFPVPAPVPDLHEGSHFSYAVQWFSFSSVALVGYAALVWRDLKPGRSARKQQDDDQQHDD